MFLCIAVLDTGLVFNINGQEFEEKLENEIINKGQDIFDKESLEYRLTKLLDIHVGGNQRLNSGANKDFPSKVDNASEVVRASRDDQYLHYSMEKMIAEILLVKNSLRKIANETSREPCYEDHSIGTSYAGRTSLGVNAQQLCQPPRTNVLNQPENDSESLPTSCKDAQENGMNISGIYLIQPNNSQIPFMVLCDMEIRGGGWTHFHKRFDGSQDFFLEYRDYKFGFGNLDGEFWLGLENMYRLTGFEDTELLVELVDRKGKIGYAHYSSFAIGPETDGYKLITVKGHSGDTGDSLSNHVGKQFSTKDLDRDSSSVKNCAEKHKGAWWYDDCYFSNLNGKFINVVLPPENTSMGTNWNSHGREYCHAKARMMIR